MTILAALAALKTHLEGTPGIVTVYDVVPNAQIPADQCPAIILDALAPRLEPTSRRRQRHWPVNVNVLATPQTTNRSEDLKLGYATFEAVLDRLDASITLDGKLNESIKFEEPASTDIGPLNWDTKTYVGAVIFAVLSLKSDQVYGP